jgi:SAM-dependent methyltransferase
LDIYRAYDDASYYDTSPLVGGNEDVAPHLRIRLSELEARLGHRGRLLDVGCALGTFVAFASEQGWVASGVDVSGWSSARARERGLAVATGTLESQHYPAQHFTVVHASHVLEHVPDPASTLQEMRRILHPDGLLALEVPQETESLFEAFRTLARIRPTPDLPSPHLYFFTAKTLRQLVASAGFRVLSSSSRHPSIEGRSRYPMGRQVAGLLFMLDNAFVRGPNLTVIASLAN